MLLTSERRKNPSRHASVTEEQILSIDEIDPCTFKISRFTSFEFFDHLRRRDFHFLLCVIIAVLLDLTQILDQLIIQIV